MGLRFLKNANELFTRASCRDQVVRDEGGRDAEGILKSVSGVV